MNKIKYAIVLCFCSFALFAQDYFPKNDGVKTKNTSYQAFTNAKIYVTPTQIIENGTLLIKDGKVVASGNEVSLPKKKLELTLKVIVFTLQLLILTLRLVLKSQKVLLNKVEVQNMDQGRLAFIGMMQSCQKKGLRVKLNLMVKMQKN